MEVYGQTGSVFTVDGTRMRVRLKDEKMKRSADAMPTDAPAADPFPIWQNCSVAKLNPTN